MDHQASNGKRTDTVHSKIVHNAAELLKKAAHAELGPRERAMAEILSENLEKRKSN